MKKIDNVELIEPVKAYRSVLKEAFHENAEELFEELAKKANINVDANHASAEEYYRLAAKADETRKKEKKYKTLKVLSLIFGFLFVIAGIILIVVGVQSKTNKGVFIAIGAVLAVLGVALVIIAFSILNKKVKELGEILEKQDKEAEAKQDECYAQMNPLNALYDWNMPARLVTKTIPLIEMDETFDPDKYQILHDNFGFVEDNSTDTSAAYVQSGSILGNPFLIEQNYCQTMRMETYVGHLTITYTTTEVVNGRTQVVTHTQVLEATYQAPKPFYYDSTWLIYGNEAAPNLSFNRVPSGANKMDEKAIEKFVKKQDKELDKLVEKRMNSDHPFMRLQNTEFESLFGALDRDNDVEFRLLFTPLSQKSMVDLITTKEPFGDDFIFRKRQKLNFIHSEHSQIENLYVSSPRSFIHFDYSEAKKNFINYFDRYFQNFFYDMAPLLSIPLYTQTKTKEYLYKENYHGNVTSYEVEAAANAHNREVFRPEGSITDIILKSEFVKKVDSGDAVNIHSYSFTGTDRIAYVDKLGGDGRIHAVPVPWVEYNEIDKVTPFVVQRTSSSRKTFNTVSGSEAFSSLEQNINGGDGVVYQKRFVSYVPNGNGIFSKKLLDSLDSKEE